MSNLSLVESNKRNRFHQITAPSLNLQEQLALIELAIEVLEFQHRPGQKLSGPSDTYKYLRLYLSGRRNEVFGVIFLDIKMQVLLNKELFQGTVGSAEVYPRVVVQETLIHNASSVIFYHNHPSGSPEPSKGDKEITSKLVNALKLVDVRVLDHIIVGSEGHISFSEQGLI